MNHTLKRRASANGATIGEWLDERGTKLCFTLEDVVREVPGMPVDSWKIPGRTAIPRGTYRVTFVNSGKFGPDTLSLVAVPGFDYIRVHAGNRAADTEGCILVGLGASSVGTLVGGTSKPALELIKARVHDVIDSGNQFWLTIE